MKYLLPILAGLFLFLPSNVWGLTYTGVTPSDSRAAQTSGVAHLITFKAVTNIGTVDTVKIDFGTATGWFPTTGTCTATGSSKTSGVDWPYSVTALPGTLTCSVDGSGVVTVGGITTGLNSTTVYGVRIAGSTAVFGTPSSGTHTVTVKTLVGAAQQESQAVKVGILGSTQVSGSATVPVLNEGTVTFSGFGAPGALVIIQDGGSIVGSTVILADGSWSKTITFSTGSHNVGLFQEDGAGRRSSTVSFTINVTAGSSQTFSNIYFSPTIATSVPSVQQGSTINIFGAAQPNATVKVTVNSHTTNVDTTSDGNGTYNLPFNTGTYNLELGLHTTFDKATNGTLISDISQVLSFTVTSNCSGADLNKDSKVNLTDFSILLYNWGQSPPPNVCSDINKDGLVNLTDFSIMLFAWTG